MLVGFNYPWPGNQYITIGPNGDAQPWLKRMTADGKQLQLAKNLADLKAAGISVVRMWLMGDGNNYDGTVMAAYDGTWRKMFWDFAPPARVHQRFLDDFRAMLTVFRQAEMRIVPVLIDFAFLDQPKRYSGLLQTIPYPDVPVATNSNFAGGRSAIALNPAYRATFIEGTLKPLLDVAKDFKESIYAFDVFNEPYWCVAPVTGGLFGPHLDAKAVAGFLSDCVAAVNAAGLPSTVGHRLLSDLSGYFKDSRVTKPQYHYYAKWYLPGDRLQPVSTPPAPFLGEFAALTDGEFEAYKKSGRYNKGELDALEITLPTWPALGTQNDDPQRILPARLAVMANLGCELAMVWPDGSRKMRTTADDDSVIDLAAVKLASITGVRFTKGMAPVM
ncbi:hypothetical protein AQI88_33570 [Streptomyces cellostaticus]|uniref:Glycoside hydrolase family 5 domain-containing protein n=1 Tax=Streptomyces cellostaticus TaxID=67285 RepID=A0A101NFD1_9ACTN|nr:hypothetical protein [Streptomyces cellostaticus]KUM92115.1 hypothetical protein AQI88_33570 [Streptomyces cellostaticus]GHI07917.1 hypothetical protein Scel_62380 [Streptomyces cellostaticus]